MHVRDSRLGVETEGDVWSWCKRWNAGRGANLKKCLFPVQWVTQIVQG